MSICIQSQKHTSQYMGLLYPYIAFRGIWMKASAKLFLGVESKGLLFNMSSSPMYKIDGS